MWQTAKSDEERLQPAISDSANEQGFRVDFRSRECRWRTNARSGSGFEINARQLDEGAEQDFSAVILQMEKRAHLGSNGNGRTWIQRRFSQVDLFS